MTGGAVALNDEQVRHLAADIAAAMLTRAADPSPERRDLLKTAIALWVPDADEFELRELAAHVGVCMNGLATLIDERKARMVATGRAEPYG